MFSTPYSVIIVVLVLFLLADLCDSDDVKFRRHYYGSRRAPRAATARKERIWPEGIIPFVITANFSGEHQHLFLRAMRHWENYTCISFVPRQPHHKHYITFTVDKCGCCSYVGRRGEGPQAISIGKNCDKFGIVVHELGHVVGFWHEHTRPDRDMYVDIFYKSIQTGQDYNFEKSKPEEVDSLGEPYDFSSIMHYARDTFSRGAFYDTILPKPSSGFRLEIGQRVQLSEGDIRQTKKLYKCAECGGTLMLESGNLEIQHTGECVWHIVSPQGHTIFLNITGSTLQTPSLSCLEEEQNMITVRDGVSITSPLLDKICGGNKLFRTIASSGNRMTIQVRSTIPSPSVPFATYYAICGGPIYANEGVIQSPKYPESYPPNSDCQWTIHVDENSQVAIEFVYFHLEQHKECIYDRLILTEGSPKSQEVSETLCGLIEKRTFVSKTNQLSLRFFSDNSVQKTGFELRFSKELNECASEKNICHHYCVNTVGGFKCACRVGYSLSSNGFSCDSTCGGYLKASNGSIASPNFPEMYPNSKTCIWEIEAPEGYHIFLNFTKFNVEGMRTECAYDFVKIGDSEKLCGEYHEPLLFTTPRNRVRIEFSSDSSVERDGFFANFIADFDECQNNNAGCEHSCQNRLGSYVCTCNAGYILAEDKHNCKEGSCFFEVNAPSGDINSPNWPNDYPKAQNCSWHFVTTPGHRLMLTFSSFQVEEHSQCKYDAVAVYDGGDGTAQLAGIFCGLAPPPLLLSSSNELFLAFTSDASVSRRGFQAHYTSVCGGRLIAESTPGHIYSHATFSDSKYGKNQDCSWSVTAKSPGRGVRVQFSTFNIESEEGCQYDYIEVYDGSEANQDLLIGRFCGDTIPEAMTSTGSELLLIMHTDNAEEEKGPRIMSDWMGRLPSSVRKKPFCTICIPGSHDSGAYWFNLRLGYAHDQSFLKYIRYFRCGFVKRIVKRWGLTQTMTIDEQLLAGIRYFDLRLELSIDGESNSQQEGAVEVVDASRKNCFIIHALYSVSWLKIANQVVNFLTDHESEIVILNVNHVYCMSEYDFRRFFLHPLTNIAARQGLQLCSTLVDLRTISLDELLEKNYRLIVVGPGDQDIDGCCFRSSMIQNRWPNKNNLSDLLSFMQAQIHAPISPGIRVMQGVLTPTLSDIVRNFRKSLRKRFSLPCRQALKHWISELDAEERDHLNVLISDQVDPEFCRLVFNLNVVDYPGIRLENVFSRISKKSIGELRWDNMRTYPTPPESYKKDRSAISNMHDDEEPDIIIEEIFESDDHPSQSLPPKKPIRTSVMIQQIEMVLMNDTSSEENVSVAPSPIPPPKPKRFSQRIPIIMEVEPIPDDAIIVPIPDAPMIPLSRSSDTPVRIALPVTAEELRLAALGQYPRYGSQMSSQRSSRVVSEERPKSAEDNEEDHSTADELCPLIPPKLDNMVESLVNHSTSDAMDNLAHRFKTSMPFE